MSYDPVTNTASGGCVTTHWPAIYAEAAEMAGRLGKPPPKWLGGGIAPPSPYGPGLPPPLGQVPVPSGGYAMVPPFFRTGPARYLYNAAEPYISATRAIQGQQRLASPATTAVGVGLTALGLAALATWISKGSAAPTRIKVAAPLLTIVGWAATDVGVAGLWSK